MRIAVRLARATSMVGWSCAFAVIFPTVLSLMSVQAFGVMRETPIRCTLAAAPL